MRLPIAILILLAACRQQPEPMANKAAPAPPAVPVAPVAKAFVRDEQNELFEFHFGWSAEAAAIPPLADRFRKDLGKVKSELAAGAKEDKAMRDKEGYDFHEHMSSTDYETAGQSGRLLSLQGDVGSYTGGAHGITGTFGLLWDRSAAKEIKVADLFTAAANMDRLTTQPWCDALNKAREEKRGEPASGGMFDECPKLTEISIIPADRDGNGKMERLRLIADPYVAGPYVEGSYEIELPVTADLIAAIRSDYRDSFEAQTQ